MSIAGTEDKIGYSQDDTKKNDYDRDSKKILKPYRRCGTSIDEVWSSSGN